MNFEDPLIKMNRLVQKLNRSKYTYQINCNGCCTFCGIQTICYFKEDVHSLEWKSKWPLFYSAYICELTYKQITDLYMHIMLFNILSTELDIDTSNIIRNLLVSIPYPNVRCIENKNKIIQYRKWYLKENFSNYTVDQLNKYFIENNMKKPKNNRKAEYLNILNANIHEKRKEWYKEQYIYPIR